MWPRREIVSEKGMVTSFHPQATMAGKEILLKGGNAVDAAVATSLALGVAEPAMSGLGGRNFAVIYMRETGKITAINANVKSGSKVQPGIFEPISSIAPEGWPRVKEDVNAEGYKAICVPGNAACLSVALKRFGKLGWEEVTEPAIRIAEKGFHVYENHIIESIDLLLKFPTSKKIYLKPDGSPYRPGEKIRNIDLANSLKSIAENGADSFYRGEISEAIIKDIEEYGGFITSEDLKNYKPKITRASLNTYRSYDIFYTLGASGGPTLIETLNILEGFEISKLGYNTPKCIHIMVESIKLAYADRFRFLADTEVSKVPLSGLLSKEYAAELRKKIDPMKTNLEAKPGNPWIYEDEDTTYLSVIDEERNMVSMTQSIHGAFGSGVVIRGTGIVMNNGMKRFNPLRGFPSSIAPNKRPLSYQSPHIVLKSETPFLSIGAPGGNKIPATLVQVLVNIIDHKMSIQEAIDKPKFHCEQREPVYLETEIPFKVSVIKQLKALGHDIGSPWPRTRMATPNGILVNHSTGKLHGGVDPRRPGLAAGY
jgi:gamma-glutamyltranspeptidase/glutathione hydrolase